MNNALVTTGLLPLTIDSVEIFQLQAFKNGIPWDLTGGSAILKMKDPGGAAHNYTATIGGGVATVTWTVIAPEGTWTRAWDITDAAGIRQVSRPIIFTVVSSP